MSNNSNFTELIDAYLTGNLSEKDKLFLEEQLKKDPILENEYHLQKELVQGIRQYRVAELKARLNALEVGTGGISTGVKIAASIAISSMIILGSYLYFNYDKTSDSDHQTLIETELQDQIVTEEYTKEKTQEQEEPTEIAPLPETTPAETISEKVTERPVANIKVTRKKESTSEKTPVVIAPEILDEFDESNPANVDSNIIVPNDKLGNVKNEGTVNIEIENKSNNKFPFHYQYFNNKLYLYGDFKGIPYEILELNNARGKNLYLYYDNNYYVIRQNQTQVVPLEPVKNQKLIKELNIIKEGK